jgi:putative inorganic carbon (hco3(-)) transporter
MPPGRGGTVQRWAMLASPFSLRYVQALGLVLGAVVTGVATAALAYKTEPWVPLAAAALVGACGLAFAQPIVALCLAIALSPLELLSFPLGGDAGVTPAEGMFVLTGLGWAAARLSRGQGLWVSSPLTWPLALLILAIVPGLLFAPETFPVLKMLLMWAAFFLVFGMVVAEGSERAVRGILFTLAISAAVVGVIAAVKTGVGSEVELRGGGETAKGRASGSFGHPNTLATFEGLALPGALALGLAGRPSWRPVALVCFVVILIGVGLSLSRGGLLAVAGALGVMLLWPPFRRAVAIAAAVVAVIAVVGGNPLGDVQQVQVLSTRIASIGYSAEGVDPRFTVWGKVPRMVADHPLLGIGGNSFPEVAPRYNLFLGGAAESTFEHAHNIAFTIAVELGLLGLAAFTWFVVALARVLLTGYRRGPPGRRGLVLALAAAFSALALQGLVDYTLRSNLLVAVLFSLAGAAVVLARSDGGAPVDRQRAAAR